MFRQFHTEGFVNTYVQQPSADDKTIVFVSEAIESIPTSYRARETYTILGRDEFTERFEIAEPGKDFELYSEALKARPLVSRTASRSERGSIGPLSPLTQVAAARRPRLERR